MQPTRSGPWRGGIVLRCTMERPRVIVSAYRLAALGSRFLPLARSGTPFARV